MTTATHTRPAPITNYSRKCVMVWAWDVKRANPARSFGDCLRAAWVAVKADFAKRATAHARMIKALRRGGSVAFSPSLIRSPSTNAFEGARHGWTLDRHAGASINAIGR